MASKSPTKDHAIRQFTALGFLYLMTLSATADEPLPQPWHQQIATAARAELERNSVPSLQIAIGHGGERIYSAAFGYADLEHAVPATPLTVYRTASVSKWLTATATMRLAEQGKLELDEPIQRYCTHYPTKSWPITPRQLLMHTSGIRHYADYDAELAAAKSHEERARIETRQLRDALGEYTRFSDMAAPLESFKHDPLLFEPDTSWLYSSFGYRVLGCVLEGAAGLPYRELVANLVLEPSGMVATRDDDAWAIVPHRASGYRLQRGAPLRRADLRDVSENLPAGGHLSTANDLIAFAAAYVDGRLVGADSIAEMTMRRRDASVATTDYASWRNAIPSAAHYGAGVMLFPHENETWFGHTGQQAGASAIVISIPERQLSIAVLTNLKGWAGYLSFVRTLSDILETNGL